MLQGAILQSGVPCRGSFFIRCCPLRAPKKGDLNLENHSLGSFGCPPEIEASGALMDFCSRALLGPISADSGASTALPRRPSLLGSSAGNCEVPGLGPPKRIHE